jgi:hypothetical protein
MKAKKKKILFEMVFRERNNFCYKRDVFLCERTKKQFCNAQSYNYFL